MLSAAEASMDVTAKDDAERAANRARLYAPPKGREVEGGRRRPPAMKASEAQALMARLAAEDARLRSG
ncbi:hypothetical protein [Streptomyces cinereoruber]|uniref:hypothetical protein n=1 Tax=Streptomyces cinereoruber TaxID=67260 RepID=UPI00363068A7